MYFKVSWDEEFDTLMMHLWGKYGKELFTLDGIGEQMDINKFSQNFFNQETTTADVSVDGNANVTQRTGIEYNFELPKPLRRYNSYYLLWKQLRKDFGLELANRIVEYQLSGDIYVNDFTDIALAYCFNYSTYDIALNGLEGLSNRPKVTRPKSFDVFIRQVEQFMVVAANSTLGATGFADFLIVASHYVKKIFETGYDGHVKIVDIEDRDREERIKTYVREKLVHFIYTVNWAFRSGQSPFSNLSVYDRPFLESLCVDYVIDGKPADIELVQWLQEIYLDAMNQELARTPLTFPVTTACFCTDENNNIIDKEFAMMVAEKNLKYGFINIYNGTTSNLSSCCFGEEQKVLTASSAGAFYGTFKELDSAPYIEHRRNFTVYHNGAWVKAKLIRLPANRKMFKVITENGKELILTDNHINLTQRGNVETSKLTINDYLATNSLSLKEKRTTPKELSFEQGYLIGLYAGDGSRYQRKGMESYSVTFSLNTGEKANSVYLLEKALKDWGIEEEIHCCIKNKLLSATVYSEELFRITEEFVSGSYSFEKSFTPAIFVESKNFREGIKAGWFASDGGNSNRIYSTSKTLIETGEALFATLGINTRIDVSDRTGERAVEIRGEQFNRNYPLYCLRWYDNRNRRNMEGIYKTENNTMYIKVKSIEEVAYTGEYVYCFEVADTNEPYFTLPNNIITHNCRLRSSTDNPYFNSFGAGSTKIGSLGVVTANLPRAAMRAVTEAEASLDPAMKEQIFMEHLRELFDVECMINHAKREIVGKRISLGAAPLYTNGYMSLNKQYSTLGVVGLNEAVEILGYDILTKEGQDFVTRVLTTINDWLLHAENQYKAPHNCEMVPAESSAVKLVKKDKMLGFDCGVPFYSNQFIPLIVKANMLDRIRLQGKFDKLFSGGAICHVNVGSEITDPQQIVDLIEYAAQQGVVYWAINYRIHVCEHNHSWVGGETCPVCGGEVKDIITRVVGFFTNVKNWNKTRRDHDWPNRQFYSSIA